MAPGEFFRAFCAVVALSAAVSIPLAGAEVPGFGYGHCPGGFANFGDSLTDTGSALDAFPFLTSAEFPPYGVTFFGAPAKRFCDGRVVPDFFSLAFDIPLLDSYFATAAFNYRFGANFAVGGATANASADALLPFSLPVQVKQFIRLKNSAEAVASQLGCANFFPDLQGIPAGYSNWLFTIEIGGNDLLNALVANRTLQEIEAIIIPQAIGTIAFEIEALYNQTARKFLIFGIPAQGCSTFALTVLPLLPTDALGCGIRANLVSQIFNTALLQAIAALRKSLNGSIISYFDYYAANIEILENPPTYGFDSNKTVALIACCGAPGVGKFNYNPAVPCGIAGSTSCPDPQKFVNWDGVHFTENFYRAISKFALDGKFTDHPVNYSSHCNLDFGKFGPKETYKGAYPFTCQNLFS